MRSVLARPILPTVLLLGLSAAFAAPNPAAKKDDPFQLTATSAILIDHETGAVLFDKNADQLVPPASLTKLMTVEVVFDQIALGNIKLDQDFRVSEHAWRKGGAPSRGSKMFLAIHSKVKVRDLLKGAIIVSGNDACITLAEAIAGNQGDFARLMNERAR